MHHYVVSAIGRDRPGIVAGIAAGLLSHEVNVEDSQMSILRGHFAMSLIVSAPDAVALEDLRADLVKAGERLGLEAVSVDEVDDLAGPPRAAASHIVTVYGADHPGIVYAIASALAGAEANIIDLQTRLVADEESSEPLYVMMLEVAVPAPVRIDALEQSLQAAAGEQELEVSIRPLDQDKL